MYSIELSARVQKFFDKLDEHLKKRIMGRLRGLKENPVPHDSKFIGRHNGEKVFRYRIGNYRALYKVKEKEKNSFNNQIR